MILLSNHELWKLLLLKNQSCRHFNLKVLHYTPSSVYKSGGCTHFLSGPDWWIASVLGFQHIIVNKGTKCWTKWSVRVLQVLSMEISLLPEHLISYIWSASPCRELRVRILEVSSSLSWRVLLDMYLLSSEVFLQHNTEMTGLYFKLALNLWQHMFNIILFIFFSWFLWCFLFFS